MYCRVVPNPSHQANTPQVQNYAAKHRLRTQKNITSNFSQARSTLPDDGTQTIRNMLE